MAGSAVYSRGMIFRPPTALLAFLLGACGSGSEERAAEPARSDSPVPARTTQAHVPATLGLPGEYRVAGLDGVDLNAPTGVAISIGENTIELARCAGLAWTYAWRGEMIEMTRIPLAAGEPVCRVPEEVARVGQALHEVNRAQRTPANGIELSGGGRSVLLFSQ